MVTFTILNYDNVEDCENYTLLLKEYYRDPMGSGKDLCDIVGDEVIRGLKESPSSIVFLAKLDENVIGMATCFKMFSTFRAKPTINIHDIFVSLSYRGKKYGQALLAEIADYATALGCCKITLEVREDNEYAQRVYRTMGYSEESINMLFWAKYLSMQE